MKKRITGLIVLLAASHTVVLFVSPSGQSTGVKSDSYLYKPVAARIPSLDTLPEIRDFVIDMDRELDRSGTVGAAYTIVEGGRVLFTHTHGETVLGSGKKVDEHTIFRLASVSKGFSGALLCKLELDGLLSLDDLVAEHYDGFQLKDSLNTADMTIRHLLSHTSGLVPYAFDNLVEAGEPLEDIVARLNEVTISAPPGKLYGYQNVMFSLVDPIAEKVSNTDYAVLMKELIFQPLGMADASAGPLETDLHQNLARPHVRTNKGYVAVKPHMGYYNVLPAAGVNASISDMSHWLQALLGYQPVSLPDTIGEMLSEPVIYTPLKSRYTRYWKPFRQRYYSLGWRIYFYRDRKIVYHGGYIRGYRAEVAFCPAENIGIAFLQNSPNNLASKVIPMFFDEWFDRDEDLQ